MQNATRIAHKWLQRLGEERKTKPVPAGPWSLEDMKAIFGKQWDYGLYIYSSRGPFYTATPADEQGIANLLDKSDGNASKFLGLVMQTVNKIKTPDVAMRRAAAIDWLIASPGSIRFIYDREGYCYGDHCIPYVKYAQEGMRAAKQVYYWKALQLAGAKDVKLPSLSVSPPPPKMKEKPTPPPIPAGMIPTTAEGWDLYSDEPGGQRAAKALAKSIEVALGILGRNVFQRQAPDARKNAVLAVAKRIRKILNTYHVYGALDTEPRQIARSILRSYLEKILEVRPGFLFGQYREVEQALDEI